MTVFGATLEGHRVYPTLDMGVLFAPLLGHLAPLADVRRQYFSAGAIAVVVLSASRAKITWFQYLEKSSP